MLGEILVASGAISEQQLREALAHQRNRDLRIGEALIELGHATEETVARALARKHGLKFVDLGKGKIAQGILDLVPAEMAADIRLVPLMEREGRLLVAIDDPMKTFALDNLRFVVNRELEAVLTTKGGLSQALSTYYGVEGESSSRRSVGAAAATSGSTADEGEDAPIIRLVTQMIEDAMDRRASDIHIEPFGDRVRVRFRVDGMLRTIVDHPAHLKGPLISRLKIMANMDIAEKRKPQDGRIAARAKGKDIDIRASILPSNHGESMVMRLLDKSSALLRLTDLGMRDDEYRWFKSVIQRPNGIFLVTGPTGSGKTTTLYAALAELNRADVKIITAEDPVEYNLPGINQVQVRHQVGLDFARILRAMLRQAPNIILVGEIRDRETAEIAIQAALTGHLVFSTLHTNDAPSAITRLVDMGVKPFLVAASVQAILAQRLVRTLCPKCREAFQPSAAELAAIGLQPEQLGGRPIYRPKGCPACGGSGYRGRKGIYEHLEMSPALREMTFRGEPASRLRALAVDSGGMTTLLADGGRKVMDGVTTIDEILRVTTAH
jgi:type IV pilus assembly protein PilB